MNLLLLFCLAAFIGSLFTIDDAVACENVVVSNILTLLTDMF